MKRFFYLFAQSGKEFKNVRSLVISGLLLAVAVAIRSLALDITPDIRISFAYLPILIIGAMYGPVVCLSANFMLDFLGVILNPRGGAYFPPLALVPVIAGIIYGVILYKKEINLIRLAVSRILVVVFCNAILNSFILYTGFLGKTLDFFDRSSLKQFWIWIIPRLFKNTVQLPFDILLVCISVPLVMTAYKRVIKPKKA